jgi:outer membrane biosynthesis protein TonB
MLPAIALFLALFAAQTTTPAAPPTEPAPSPATTQSAPPCHSPDSSGLYDHVCGVAGPKLVYRADPEFPEAARKRNFLSIVKAALIVTADGKPADVHVIDSQVDKVDKNFRKAQQEIEDSAVAAIKQYQFAPATYQGKPVPVSLHVAVRFQIF